MNNEPDEPEIRRQLEQKRLELAALLTPEQQAVFFEYISILRRLIDELFTSQLI
jgi:hypothetical protein